MPPPPPAPGGPPGGLHRTRFAKRKTKNADRKPVPDFPSSASSGHRVSCWLNAPFGMDDIEQVRSCFNHCAAGKFPHVLMGNGACNSAVDPTYAPTNGHSAFWWPFAPYAVDGDPNNWDHQRDDYMERVLGVWREYAANLDDSNVRAKLLFTPLDIERLNVNMVRGAVRMGAYIPSQLGINRPHPLLSGTRTPIEGLYLCGSSTGNGGSINGAPGYIAANAIADDLELERPWARVPPPEWRH